MEAGVDDVVNAMRLLYFGICTQRMPKYRGPTGESNEVVRGMRRLVLSRLVLMMDGSC